MPRFAAQTSVSAEKSRIEIERTVRRYGATKFGSGWEPGSAQIHFEIENRRIRIILPMPDRDSKEFTMTATGRERNENQAEKAWEQATRQRWRALALVVKAKLEAVDSGISTIEEEFLAWTVLPDGRTAGDIVLPAIDEAYKTGKTPKLLTFEVEKE